MHIPELICDGYLGSGCGQAMTAKKNGLVVEMMRSKSEPYYKISTDRYQCSACGHTVLIPAREALTEHYMPGYSDVVASIQAWFEGRRR